jgi:hypothetical protein
MLILLISSLNKCQYIAKIGIFFGNFGVKSDSVYDSLSCSTYLRHIKNLSVYIKSAVCLPPGKAPSNSHRTPKRGKESIVSQVTSCAEQNISKNHQFFDRIVIRGDLWMYCVGPVWVEDGLKNAMKVG